MITSYEGKNFIIGWEGLRLSVYDDGGGVLTAGIGHKVSAHEGLKMGDTISDDLARTWFEEDLAGPEAALNALAGPLQQHEFDALISFLFNVGVGAFKASTLRQKLLNDDFSGAADEFNKWIHNGGKIVPGLVKRRAAERRLFLIGNYDTAH